MTEHHPDPVDPDDPRGSEPTETESPSDAKDPIDESDPLEGLGAGEDIEGPDGSPRTSPTD